MCAGVEASEGDVKLTHDGPVVLGGTITFKAELVDSDGQTPSGKFMYTWADNAIKQHTHQVMSCAVCIFGGETKRLGRYVDKR